MGYRIRTRITVRDSWMRAADIIKLAKSLRDELPESNFIGHLLSVAQDALVDYQGHGDARVEARVELKARELWWSGNYASESLLKVAPFIQGHFEAVFFGEGELCGGVIVDDGKVTDCDALVTLIPKNKTAESA